MPIFKKKAVGDLNFNFNAVAGYTYPWLPFSKRALSMAFPHLTVKPQTVPAFHSNRPDAPGFGLYADDMSNPAFYVDNDSDGYSFSVTTDNSQALILGKYRIGESLLHDFRTEYLTEAEIMLDGSAVMVLASCSVPDIPYSIRFLFSPSADFQGDLKKAKKDDLGNCILSEARIFISGRRIRPLGEINEAQGVKLLKMENYRATPKPLPMGLNQRDGDPIAYLFKSEYSTQDASESYMKLTELALYNAPPETVKSKIEKIFKDHVKPDDIIREATYMFHNDWNTMFMFTLDWSAEAQDFTHHITLALGERVKQLELPDISETPYQSIAAPGMFESYSKSLKDAGLDLWSIETNADHHALFIANAKDRQAIQKLVETMYISAHPA